MKIALVCPYDISQYGGVQNQVLEFAVRARKVGHDVTVIGPNSKEERRYGFVSIGKPMPIPVGKGTVPKLALLYNHGKLRELLENGHFDVVHMHEPVAPAIGPDALEYTDIKTSALVTTSHTNMTPNLVTWAYSTFGRMLGRDHLIDKVEVRTAVSLAAADRANHYLPGSYVIIPNGIDVARFSPANAEPYEKYVDGKINILFVGRLGEHERRKGLDNLVSAFNALNVRYPNTRLLVVGPGKPDKDTRAIINAANNENVVLAGPASAADLPRYYQTGDICAFTPTDGESFSLVVAEAMSSGKPVVTSNIPGPREVLLGYGNYGNDVADSKFFVTGAGILVPPRDVPATTRALEMLVRDESVRLGMGARGREIVMAKFSWDVIAPLILAQYEKLLESRKDVL